MVRDVPNVKKFSKYEAERYHYLHQLTLIRARQRIHGKAYQHEIKKEQCAMKAARRDYYVRA